MATHKSLLRRVDIELAKGRRTCKHNPKHAILKGQLSVIVCEGQYNRRPYCAACGFRMIEQARVALADIERQLTGNENGSQNAGGDPCFTSGHSGPA